MPYLIDQFALKKLFHVVSAFRAVTTKNRLLSMRISVNPAAASDLAMPLEDWHDSYRPPENGHLNCLPNR